jgi:hypothetical protein
MSFMGSFRIVVARFMSFMARRRAPLLLGGA